MNYPALTEGISFGGSGGGRFILFFLFFLPEGSAIGGGVGAS